MYELERVAAVIKPTQAFLDWIQLLPEEDNSELELADIREDCTTLLIPAFESPEEADEYIQEIFADIFANELEGWHEDPDTWPDEPSYEMFKEWFDIEYHSMVFDMVEEADDEDALAFDDEVEDEEDFEEYEFEEGEDDDDEYEDDEEDEYEDDDEYEEDRR